jgi:hypothetical protein
MYVEKVDPLAATRGYASLVPAAHGRGGGDKPGPGGGDGGGGGGGGEGGGGMLGGSRRNHPEPVPGPSKVLLPVSPTSQAHKSSPKPLPADPGVRVSGQAPTQAAQMPPRIPPRTSPQGAP